MMPTWNLAKHFTVLGKEHVMNRDDSIPEIEYTHYSVRVWPLKGLGTSKGLNAQKLQPLP